jgi:hypothetical protein
MARSTKEKAALYAAFKLLERAQKEDGDLPPGIFDVSGQSITIKFAPGTIVERDPGVNGDGVIEKKAIQNLYGYPVMALLADKLMKFHQWNVLKKIILQSITDVLKHKGAKDVRAEIRKEYPHTCDLMDQLQNEMPIPDRKEDTPRLCNAEREPTITMRLK